MVGRALTQRCLIGASQQLVEYMEVSLTLRLVHNPLLSLSKQQEF